MNYKIILDDNLFKQFIDLLPDTSNDEQYYFALFARSKYDSTNLIKSDKQQLARNTTTKDRLYSKIKKLEINLGDYLYNGKSIDESALALYIHPNPRSLKRANIKTAKMILDNISKEHYTNPKSLALTALQNSKSNMYFFDFDIDCEKYTDINDLRNIIVECIGEAQYYIIETRGGYHILICPETIHKDFKKKWYSNLLKKLNIDQKGDLLLPIPGCRQGDFIPKIIL